MCCRLGPQWAWHPWGAVRESASQSVSHSDSGPGEAGPAAGPKPLQSQTWNLKNVLWSGLVTQQKGPARPAPGQAGSARGAAVGFQRPEPTSVGMCVQGARGQVAGAEAHIPARHATRTGLAAWGLPAQLCPDPLADPGPVPSPLGLFPRPWEQVSTK